LEILLAGSIKMISETLVMIGSILLPSSYLP